MPLTKKDNVYKIMINEKEFIVKFFEKKIYNEDKNEVEIYLQEIDKTFKDLKEFRLYINFLSDIAEDLYED